MAVRPVEDARKDIAGAWPETGGERRGFRVREIREQDALADVERRGRRIGHQIAGDRDAEQAERQSRVRRIVDTPVVALANPGEELVRAEREASSGVDFVDEDHDL